jgi:hypothetical protein
MNYSIKNPQTKSQTNLIAQSQIYKQQSSQIFFKRPASIKIPVLK